MSIKIAEAHKRCKTCSNYRAQRYCPRKGKDICWECCNGMRIDRKCPRECAYIIQNEKESGFDGSVLKAKVDSLQELRALTKRLFDIWCESPAKAFDNKIPVEMSLSEEGRIELKEYLAQIEDMAILPAGYITRKLKISLPAREEPAGNYEHVSEQYIKRLIANEWEESIELISGNQKYHDQEQVLSDQFKRNYISRRSENRLLKKITSYRLLFSALSENREDAIAYYEINSKYDLSIILNSNGEKWLVKELIIGSPSFYYGEREAIVLISGFISRQEMDKAKQYLKKYEEVLIDSADLSYLNGLYHLLTKDYTTALKHYLTAVELDPGFYEYKYNLALVYQMLQSYETARELYKELLAQKEDDINVLNNLAVIHEAEGNMPEALRLLKKCLEYDPSSELALKNIERIKKK